MISKNRLKYLASLRLKKHRDADGRFLVEGVRLIEEVLNSLYKIEELVLDPGNATSPRAQKLIATARSQGIRVSEISGRDFERITQTVHSQGVVGVVARREWQFVDELNRLQGLVVAIDCVNDPGNVGTIIRTAGWFGANAILLGMNSVELTNPKTVRASMGALFHLPIFANVRLSDCLPALRERGYQAVVAEVDAPTVFSEATYQSKTLLILGNEYEGVANDIRATADLFVRIPGRGQADSLNVAIAAGILMAEIARQNIESAYAAE